MINSSVSSFKLKTYVAKPRNANATGNEDFYINKFQYDVENDLEAISGVLQETSDQKSLIRNLKNVKEDEVDSTIFNELKQWLVNNIEILVY